LNASHDTEVATDIMDAKVRDVMTPGPIGVDYYQTVGDAARIMRDWGVGAVLVVHDQALYGLVTDRDLVVRAVAETKGPDELVGPLSSANLIGVDVDADAHEAGRLMRENAVHRLPVIEDGQVAGIVSLGDLAIQDDLMLTGSLTRTGNLTLTGSPA
jgi:signal-transduction protein with cAMP-binding, CBS, and nucleotidyltransferase domain